jgi:hypothetical protein
VDRVRRYEEHVDFWNVPSTKWWAVFTEVEAMAVKQGDTWGAALIWKIQARDEFGTVTAATGAEAQAAIEREAGHLAEITADFVPKFGNPSPPRDQAVFFHARALAGDSMIRVQASSTDRAEAVGFVRVVEDRVRRLLDGPADDEPVNAASGLIIPQPVNEAAPPTSGPDEADHELDQPPSRLRRIWAAINRNPLGSALTAAIVGGLVVATIVRFW